MRTFLLGPAASARLLTRLATAGVILAVILLGFYGLVHPARSAELLMFEEPGCVWCARWNDEIGVVYDKTPEGRRAPLRRIDMAAQRPPDLASVAGVRFSPTFILLEGKEEIGRIVGYPGEHFFWPMLQVLLARLDGSPVE